MSTRHLFVTVRFVGARETGFGLEAGLGALQQRATNRVRSIHLGLWALALLFCLSATLRADDGFPKPEGLLPQVEFWKRVFTEWTEHHVAIHDDYYTGVVYSVVDLSGEAAGDRSETWLRAEKKRRVDTEMTRISGILRRLERSTKYLTAEESRVSQLLDVLPKSRRYSEARARLRPQTGLKERFARGVEISRRYLPEMEEIFRQEGVPIRLTRLPFIESSFNILAYSRVGAAGIWQFIPSSARMYNLAMNEIVDERRDPLLATRAAARHLRDDYASLQTWPLAVTGYNHGRSGVARAVKAVGSRDIMEIIRRYRGPAFRFASRNFYASYVAAYEVEQEAEKYFGKLAYEPRIAYDEVHVEDYVAFAALASLAGVSVPELHRLNPAFEYTVVSGKLYVPRGTRIRIPAGRRGVFQTAYAALPAGKRHASQRVYLVQHRVGPGQTVGWIARHYGTTSAAIQATNNLRSVHRIRIGQVLKVPRGRGAKGRPLEGRRAAVTTVHWVERGETLGAIARRYGTSTGAIQEANGLSSAHHIRIGQRLDISGASGSGGGRRHVKHRVRRGQTVGSIARRYGTTIKAIQQVNNLGSSNLIRVGQVLKIPKS